MHKIADISNKVALVTFDTPEEFEANIGRNAINIAQTFDEYYPDAVEAFSQAVALHGENDPCVCMQRRIKQVLEADLSIGLAAKEGIIEYHAAKRRLAE